MSCLLASCDLSTLKDFRKYCDSKNYTNILSDTKHCTARQHLTYIIKCSCLRNAFASIYAAHILLSDSK